MPQAIRTYFIPCTDTRGDRIAAECIAKRKVYSWPYGLDQEDAHLRAARELLKELDWQPDELSTGQLKDGSYVHTLIYRRK